jgi:hypothetical protein
MNVIFRIAALAALMATGSASAAGTVYKFKDEPRTGSLVARNVAFSQVPFDRRYADLSAEQRDVVRAAYEHMGADDEPPFPAYGLKPIFRLLARLEQSQLKAGPLRAAVMVGVDGKPVSVRVLDAPNEFLTDFVGKALMLQNYKPAVCAGQPCGQEFLLLATLTAE